MVQEGQLPLKGEKVGLAKRLLKWGFNDPKWNKMGISPLMIWLGNYCLFYIICCNYVILQPYVEYFGKISSDDEYFFWSVRATKQMSKLTLSFCPRGKLTSLLISDVMFVLLLILIPYGSKHCLRRYLTLQIIAKLYPKHFLRRYLDP